MTAELGDRLAARTEALVGIPSESRDEEAILEEIERLLPATWTVVAADAVRLALPERRPGAPLVLLVGHVDTVPVGRSAPGRREGGTIHGRGTTDMKGGLAVMSAVAEDLASGAMASRWRTQRPGGVSGAAAVSSKSPTTRCSTIATAISRAEV